MNSMHSPYYPKMQRSGFTLIEVVLALGVFFVSILALIGLLAPMLQSVDEIEKIDEITSVVNTVNAFLQSSPEIAVRDGSGIITKTKFDAIYEAVSQNGGNEATIFVYRYYDDDDQAASEGRIRLEVGFSPNENVDGEIIGTDSIVNEPDANPANFNAAAGPIFRVVLTTSPVTPFFPGEPQRSQRTQERNDDGIYELTKVLSDYPEGSLAFEARIFAEDPPGPSPAEFDTDTDLSVLNDKEPDFTFNTAIVR